MCEIFNASLVRDYSHKLCVLSSFGHLFYELENFEKISKFYHVRVSYMCGVAKKLPCISKVFILFRGQVVFISE